MSSGADHTPRSTFLAGARNDLDDPEFLRRVDRDILRVVELLENASSRPLNPAEAKEALFLVGSKNLNVSTELLQVSRAYADGLEHFDSQLSRLEDEFSRHGMSTNQASMKQDLEQLQALVKAGLDVARHDTMDLAKNQSLALAGLHLLTAVQHRLKQRHDHLRQLAVAHGAADLFAEPARETQGHPHSGRVVGTCPIEPKSQNHGDGEQDPRPNWPPQPLLKGVRERCASMQASPSYPYMLEQVDQQLEAAVQLLEMSRAAPLVPRDSLKLFLLIGSNDESVEPESLDELREFDRLGKGVDRHIRQAKEMLSGHVQAPDKHSLNPKITPVLETLGKLALSLTREVMSPCSEILQKDDLSLGARTLFHAFQSRFDVRINELVKLAGNKPVTGGEPESRAILPDVPVGGAGDLGEPAPVRLSGEGNEGESVPIDLSGMGNEGRSVPESPASEGVQQAAPAITVDSAVGPSSLQLDSGIGVESGTRPVTAESISPIPRPVDTRTSRESTPSPRNAPPRVGGFGQQVERALELHDRWAVWSPGSVDRRTLDARLASCEDKLNVFRAQAKVHLEAVLREGRASPKLEALVHRLRLRFDERVTRVQSLMESLDRDVSLPQFRAISGVGESAASATSRWRPASKVEQDTNAVVYLLNKSINGQVRNKERQELRGLVGDNPKNVLANALDRLKSLVNIGKAADLQIMALEQSLDKLKRTSLSDGELSELVALVGPIPDALGPEASGHLLNCLELGAQFDQAIARVEELKSGPSPVQSTDEIELNSRIDQCRILAQKALNRPLRALESLAQINALPQEVQSLVQGLHQEFDARSSRLAGHDTSN